MHDSSWYNSDKPVRTHGAGALRWQPLLYGAESALMANNAVFSNNTVKPSGTNKHCEIYYEIDVPYYVSYIQIEGFVKASGSDYCGLNISSDGGRTLTPLQQNMHGSFRVRNGLEERKAGKTSVQFARKFLLKFDLHSHSSTVTSEIEGLRITVGYQHNMFTQPFILPGKNTLYLEGNEVDGTRLKATWNYSLKGADGKVNVESSRDGRIEKAIDLCFDNVQDITMRGLVISCESSETKK